MKKLIPSFRLQLLILFIALLLISVMFTRAFFIKSNNVFLQRLSEQNLLTGIESLYHDYKAYLPEAQSDAFDREIEALMRGQKTIDLSVDLYQQQVAAYSRYIFIFIVLSVFLIFILSINLITRPLRRLQAATQELMSGNIRIHVRENPFSPINDLIVSFNQMVVELDRQRKIAIAAEKQLVWREVARVMAHEIKNPLTPIKLSVERLEMKTMQNSVINPKLLANSLAVIREEVANLQALVDRFRGFAALPEAQPELYSIKNQIEEIIASYQPKHRIELICENEIPPIHADKMQIKQALVNLIQNALQAADKPDLIITITIAILDNWLVISIRDNGPGIPPENLEKILEPYFTTRRKGTGLGLPIVKKIVENHGGNISIESRINAGTTVFIRLPVYSKMED